MAPAREADDVVYLCGLIASDTARFDHVLPPLTDLLGPVDLVSETWPFDLTHYYDQVMGSPLWRRFVSFARPASPGRLAEVKQATNALEAKMAAGGTSGASRAINLDPGYIAPAKLVLGSRKDFAHRVYLGGGVYGEVTMQWRGGRWQALDWTFPDFASGRYDAFLTAVRQRLLDDRRPTRSQETE